MVFHLFYHSRKIKQFQHPRICWKMQYQNLNEERVFDFKSAQMNLIILYTAPKRMCKTLLSIVLIVSITDPYYTKQCTSLICFQQYHQLLFLCV